MITEKKKRTPKPAMTPEVEKLVTLCLPFLNAGDDEAELLETAISILKHEFHGCVAETKIKFRKPNSDWHIKKTRDLARKMIEIAIHGPSCFRDRSLSIEQRDEKIKEIEEFEQEIGDTIFEARDDNKVILIEWRGKNNTAFEEKIDFRDFDPERQFLHLIICWIAEAFNTAKRRPGRDYIGYCPRCGKIFEKKRGDQEYCGKACASTERTIRQRKKEKP